MGKIKIRNKQLAWRIHEKTGIPMTDALIVLEEIPGIVLEHMETGAKIEFNEFLSMSYKKVEREFIKSNLKNAPTRLIKVRHKKKLTVKVAVSFQDKINGIHPAKKTVTT